MTDSRSAKLSSSVSQGIRARWAAIIGAALITILTGPFGTISLPLPNRTLFWTALIIWNGLKWELWSIALTRHPASARWKQLAILIAGPFVLNATMPFEVEFAYAAVGVPVDLPRLYIWLIASAISIIIGLTLFLAGMLDPPSEELPQEVPPIGDANPPVPRILERAGVTRTVDLVAAFAEDHYVRLHLQDGRKPLVLYRFGDALNDLEPLAGERVHRGIWVATHAVTAARREGRNWRLTLTDGSDLPVGGTYLAAVKARGWLTV